MRIIGKITLRSNAQSLQSRAGEVYSLQRIRITSGNDNIVCTAFSDEIARCASISDNTLVVADIAFATRQWQTAEGEERLSLEATLKGIAPL